MRHLPNKENKWIMHAIDHWSKFNFAYAIESKQAVHVARVLQFHIFPYFGVPRIVHSDNGREFINKVSPIMQCISTFMYLMNSCLYIPKILDH